MRRAFRIVSATASVVALAGLIGFTTAASAGGKKMDPIEQGKQLAFNKKKGNCLACHLIVGGKQPGNIAPPLVAMKARFPDRAVLRAQITNPQAANPDTMMPPFTAHAILSAKEIDLIVDFIHSL